MKKQPTVGPFIELLELQKRCGLPDAALDQAIRDLESVGLVYTTRDDSRQTVHVARVFLQVIG